MRIHEEIAAYRALGVDDASAAFTISYRRFIEVGCNHADAVRRANEVAERLQARAALRDAQPAGRA